MPAPVDTSAWPWGQISTHNTTIISTSTAAWVGFAGEIALIPRQPRRALGARVASAPNPGWVRRWLEVHSPLTLWRGRVHAADAAPIWRSASPRGPSQQRREMIMRPIASALIALSILGFAAQAVAYDPDAHDAKRFFAERDREAR